MIRAGLALAAFLAVLTCDPLPVPAGDHVVRGSVFGTLAGPRPLVARIAILGDVQNYVRIVRLQDFPGFGYTEEQLAEWNATAELLLRELIDDVIAFRPDFVIVAGDLAADNGGFDQNPPSLMEIADDPNTLNAWTNNQLVAYRTRAYDRLLAEGIPAFHVVGNHDSCDDFERIFPAAEWLAYDWGIEVNVRPGLCGLADVDDTTHRVGLFQTPIGPICVMGIPTSSTDWDDGLDADNAWLETTVGCGSSLPTIIVTHTAGATAWANTYGNRNKVIGVVIGHELCDESQACSEQTAMTAGAGAFDSILVFVNSQNQPPGPIFAGDNGTGGAWWSSWVIDPNDGATGSATLQSHNPVLGNVDQPPPGYSAFVNGNTTLPFADDYCARFGGPACP